MSCIAMLKASNGSQHAEHKMLITLQQQWFSNHFVSTWCQSWWFFFLQRIHAIYIYNTLQRRHHLAIVTANSKVYPRWKCSMKWIYTTISGLFHKVMQWGKILVYTQVWTLHYGGNIRSRRVYEPENVQK